MAIHQFLRFEWDERKQKANIRKHGISFIEARSVFLDENGIFISDPDHSELEDRFLMIGMSAKARMLVVAHCFRNGQIRLISARKATIHEPETLPGYSSWETNTIFQMASRILTISFWKSRSPFAWIFQPSTISRNSRRKLACLIKAWSIIIWGIAQNQRKNRKWSGISNNVCDYKRTRHIT